MCLSGEVKEMINKTFKEIDKESKIIKEIKKAGLSIAIIFSKEDISRFNLKYGDKIDLGNAEIIREKS
jgi:hypothetical protein